MCVLLARATEGMPGRLRRTLMIGTLVSSRWLQHGIFNGFSRADRNFAFIRAAYPLRAHASKPGGIQYVVLPASSVYRYRIASDRYEKTSVLLLRYLGVDTIFEGALRAGFILDGEGDGPARCKLEVPSDREDVSGVHHIEGGAKRFVGFDRGPPYRASPLYARAPAAPRQ